MNTYKVAALWRNLRQDGRTQAYHLTKTLLRQLGRLIPSWIQLTQRIMTISQTWRPHLSDLSRTAPNASGNLPMKSWSGTASRKSVRIAKRFFLTSWKKNDAASHLPLAGFCIRFVAKLIDGVILGIIGMLLYATAIFLLLWTDAIFMPSARMLTFISVYMSSILSYLAYGAFFVGQYGATPGKLALGLKVVDVDGCKVGYIKALGRCLSEIVSAIPFAFGYIIAAFDTEKRTLHDRICGTRSS